MTFLLFLVCSEDKVQDNNDFIAPEIWGLETLDDINPDPDIVEVLLEASAILNSHH